MPCFSASKLRFVGANPQQQQFSSKERARTSLGPRNALGSNQNLVTKRQCEEIMQVRGYGPLELGKLPPGRNRGKPSKIASSKPTAAMLPQKEFERLKTAAKVVTVEERLDALMKAEQENKRLEAEADSNRERFKKMDDARKRAEESNLEQEDLFGAGDKIKVLERSFLAKTEQEEEVKRANRIILNAKCHAIRDAQIQEKEELEREMRNEEKRIEKLVNENAVKALDKEDQKVEKEREDRLKYAREIKQQLSEREKLRFLEQMRLEQEAKMLRRANDAIKRDDERLAKLARERRDKFREELNRIAEMSKMFKKMLCEQERETEMRVTAYMREKEARERALQVEKQMAKEEMLRKQQRTFTLAQKVLESKSAREETGYLREQEKLEREYRRKEKEAVMRKRQIEKELTEARAKQLKETKHRQALQIARAEHEFHDLMDQLKDQENKQKNKEIEIERKRQCYRNDIIRQMGDKELERRRLLEFERNTSMAWRESERQRDANIRAVIKAKLDAMRDACLPEKYIKEVEKQMQKIAITRNVMEQPNN